MAKEDKIAPFEFLQTWAFSLLRKWMNKGNLSESETLELVEIQREMLATGIKSEFESLKTLLETKIDAQNSKDNLLITMVGSGIAIALGIGGWLIATVLSML
ncbi:MAG: hypothetical protein OXF06_03940 [Bacteroidetes bacterium]|nr:hypothetical protein [Bacteroidota bacterium]MCY4223969.1 hypothetical protein [Bacteroidota bacterium]